MDELGDGVLEENILEIYFCGWCYFIPEVESLDVNTRHLQTDTITGNFVLDILYTSASYLLS